MRRREAINQVQHDCLNVSLRRIWSRGVEDRVAQCSDFLSLVGMGDSPSGAYHGINEQVVAEQRRQLGAIDPRLKLLKPISQLAEPLLLPAFQLPAQALNEYCRERAANKRNAAHSGLNGKFDYLPAGALRWWLDLHDGQATAGFALIQIERAVTQFRRKVDDVACQRVQIFGQPTLAVARHILVAGPDITEIPS